MFPLIAIFAMSSVSSINASQRCSATISYRCCKSKQFIHFVCVKCSNVFHKSCLSKYRNQITFVKDNKIVCCKTDSDFSISSDSDDEKINLEKTINELAEDSDIKNKYILKLKQEREQFVKEALKSEEEMSELINRQDKIIYELKEQLRLLKKERSEKIISTKTVSTQTSILNKCKNASTSSKPFHKLVQNNSTQTFIADMNCIGTQTEDTKNYSIKEKEQDVTQHTNMTIGNNVISANNKSKHKIILLTDDLGHGLNLKLRRKLPNHQITSFIKPGAHLSSVMENIENIAKLLTIKDTIIIMAGKNDLDSNKFPIFKFICENLKKCSHTNIIFSSVPFTNNKSRNARIYKYNSRLHDFIVKLNSVTEGNMMFYEINSQGSKIKSEIITKNLINLIVNNSFISKTLLFINVNDVIPDKQVTSNCDSDSSEVHVVNISQLNSVNIDTPLTSITEDIIKEKPTPTSASTSNFLYPRLSQTTLLN